MKTIISSANAPAAIGPYSQCVKAGSLVFPSGQLPINPATGEMVTNDIKKATAQCLDNIKALLEEAGSSLDKAIKVSVYLSDLNDFAAMNEVYSTYFPENPPARLCVEVAKLPKDSQIEIDAIATTN